MRSHPKLDVQLLLSFPGLALSLGFGVSSGAGLGFLSNNRKPHVVGLVQFPINTHVSLLQEYVCGPLDVITNFVCMFSPVACRGEYSQHSV